MANSMDVARGGTGILSWIGGYLLVTLLRISLLDASLQTNKQHK